MRCNSTDEARDRGGAAWTAGLPTLPCLFFSFSFSFSALARTTAAADEDEEDEDEDEREEKRILASSRSSSLTPLPSTDSSWGAEKTAKSSVCWCALKGLPSMRRREREESLDRCWRSFTVDSLLRDKRRARKAPS